LEAIKIKLKQKATRERPEDSTWDRQLMFYLFKKIFKLSSEAMRVGAGGRTMAKKKIVPACEPTQSGFSLLAMA
jgi:hypothetical protein